MIRNALALIEIRRDRRKTEAQLLEIKKRRLFKLLCYVNKHVPFYRDYFKGIHYNPKTDYKGLDDLKLLPIINKQTIRDHGYYQFMSDEYNIAKLNTDHSSGSTGEPFRFYRNPQFYAYQLAIFMSVLVENGYRITDKMLSFSNPARLKTGRSFLQHFNILRRLPVDFNLPPTELLKKVMEYKPQVMFGNPSSFELLFLEMKKQQIKIDFVKIVFAGGTSVTEAAQQACFDRLGIRITEFYGSIEFSTLAYKNGYDDYYNLNNFQTVFEFLDENNMDVEFGQSGKIILTSLLSKALPFIRYDIGDRASALMVRNRFGEKALKIKQLVGRESDIATLKDGRKIAYQHVFSLLNKHIGILQFKVVQERSDHFTIFLVTENDEYFRDNIELISTKFENLFKNSASFSIENVPELLIERGGKIKTFVPLPLQ
jgi:phenylacetate-CoA ligase